MLMFFRCKRRRWPGALLLLGAAAVSAAPPPKVLLEEPPSDFFDFELSFLEDGRVASIGRRQLVRPLPYAELSPFSLLPEEEEKSALIASVTSLNSSAAVSPVVDTIYGLNNREPLSFLQKVSPVPAKKVEEMQQVLGRLAKYCTHAVADSDWLECTMNAAGTGYKACQGNYGVALFVNIVYGPKSAVELRKGGTLKLGARSANDVEWAPDAVVPLTPGVRIPAIMKSVFGGRTSGNTMALGGVTLSPLEKEVVCNRFASSIKFGGTAVPVGPLLYDMLVARQAGKTWHSYSAEGFLQEQLQGMVASNLMHSLFGSEIQSILDNLTRVFTRFTVAAAGTSGSPPASTPSNGSPPSSPLAMLQLAEAPWRARLVPTSPHNSNSNNNVAVAASATKGAMPATANVAMPPFMASSAVWADFRRAVSRATAELWMRGRLRMQFAYTIFAALESLWNGGMMHCDSHFANIFMLERNLTTQEELVAAKKSGLVAMPFYRIFLSDTDGCSSNERTYLRRGMRAYQLDVAHIRWIDSARALPVTDIHKAAARHVAGGGGNSSPAELEARLPVPCITLRKMPDDVTELMREGTEKLLGDYNTTRSYTRAIPKLKQKAGPHFHHWQARTRMDRTDPQAWAFLTEWLYAYQLDAERIDNMLRATKRALEANPSMAACQRAWKVATRKLPPDTPTAACNLASLRVAIREMQNYFVQNYNVYFPASIVAPPLRSPLAAHMAAATDVVNLPPSPF